LAHLLKFDSVHGLYASQLELDQDAIIIDGKRIRVLGEPDPTKLPWQELNIDVVMECTGRFTKREQAAKHVQAGAASVLISGPSSDADKTVVFGVNELQLNDGHRVVSNASCTTNCLAPVAKVINDLAGIESGFMTTVHSYTADQSLVDMPHKDLRRARAASMSSIPTSTGAARALKLVIPELEGKVDGSAIRVPTANVSMVDLTVHTSKTVGEVDINEACRQAADGVLSGVLAINDMPLVSIDFTHNAASSVFDVTQTKVMPGNTLRVVAWYDNEWGFANRMCDTASYLGRLHRQKQ
jgi:glyceraldehyde 3-phosphate dehydrogenase